jgi:amiloride-sensitive sodium channel
MARDSPKSDKSIVPSACGNLQQYCLNSSLHGLKYCGTSALTAFERIFFGISFAFVMVLAAYFISNVYQKWQESPVIVSGNPSFTKIQVQI